MSPSQPTKAETTPTPTEAELSRIAREAVRQPADPRLDKQLERMGLTDAPAATASARRRTWRSTRRSKPSREDFAASSRSSGSSSSRSRSSRSRWSSCSFADRPPLPAAGQDPVGSAVRAPALGLETAAGARAGASLSNRTRPAATAAATIPSVNVADVAIETALVDRVDDGRDERLDRALCRPGVAARIAAPRSPTPVSCVEAPPPPASAPPTSRRDAAAASWRGSSSARRDAKIVPVRASPTVPPTDWKKVRLLVAVPSSLRPGRCSGR